MNTSLSQTSPTKPQIDILKQIQAKKISEAKNVSMWKQMNILEKKKLIYTNEDGNWELTDKGKTYL